MKKKRILLPIAILIIGFLLLHLTPNMALKTKVFFMGHPITAFSTKIIEDKFHNETDKEEFVKLNAEAYTITKPPLDINSGVYLRNYLVRKIGFLYFAKYLGEA